MHRFIQIIERNGQTHQVPMNASRAAFYFRLAELKAATDPTITFHDVVIEQVKKGHQVHLQNR